MPSYSIQNETLVRAKTRTKTTGPAGVVQSREALDAFIEDFRHYRHDTRCVVLRGNVEKEFGLWQLAHNKRMSEYRKESLRLLFKLAGNAVTVNGVGIIGAVAGMYQQIAQGVFYESKHPQFMTVQSHQQTQLTDGVLVDLINDFNGQNYAQRPGMSWDIIIAGVRKQRVL